MYVRVAKKERREESRTIRGWEFPTGAFTEALPTWFLILGYPLMGSKEPFYALPLPSAPHQKLPLNWAAVKNLKLSYNHPENHIIYCILYTISI